VNKVELIIGSFASVDFQFTQEKVRQFAELSGDRNPIHLDAEFAASTRFGKPIVHGIFVSSLFSQVIAEQLPGSGAIYLEQSLKFVAPVYVGDTVTAKVEVVEIPKPKILILKTMAVKANGQIVIEGRAVVKC
jgi:acyl dehydratase